MKSKQKKLLVEMLSPTDETTKDLALQFSRSLKRGDIICLEGDLGAGKTTFVKGMAAAFGIEEEEITSPTFTYLHLTDPLAHFDLYRLKNAEEFISMGFEEYFCDDYITCIEWPGIIENILPPHFKVMLEYEGQARKIKIYVNVPACVGVTDSYETPTL